MRDCSISQLCIPFTLNAHDQLDNIIEEKPIQKGQTLFKAGDELKSLYAIRSGPSSYTITEQGRRANHRFPSGGDLVGFDAIGGPEAPSFAQALETSMVCEIHSKPSTICPAKCLTCVSRSRLMSGEIKATRT